MESIGNYLKQFFSFGSSNNMFYSSRRIKTNYECGVCRSTGRVPNMLGRFIKISNTQEQCNGCGTIYTNVTTITTDTTSSNTNHVVPVASCVMIRN